VQPFAIVSKTFQTTTPESAEDGDFSESGFRYEDRPMSLAELVDELKECSHLSASHVGFGTWAITEEIINYRTGESTTEGVHVQKIFGKAPKAKQLQQIYRIAGLVK
jgi:hypothetical protein